MGYFLVPTEGDVRDIASSSSSAPSFCFRSPSSSSQFLHPSSVRMRSAIIVGLILLATSLLGNILVATCILTEGCSFALTAQLIFQSWGSFASPKTAASSKPFWTQATSRFPTLPMHSASTSYPALDELYRFIPTAPSLTTVNYPLPPVQSIPFPVDINTARLSALYTWLRAGIGVVIGVTGGSVSSGHGINQPPLAQRQTHMYAARLVQWLNRYYPVRNNNTHRFLNRHVLWNVAKPGSSSQWSSLCLDIQFREVAAAEQFASEGNADYVRRRWERKENLSEPASTHSPTMQYHLPDLLFVEFGINDVYVPEADGSARAHGEIARNVPNISSLLAINENANTKAAQSVERIVRALLSNNDSPTAVVILGTACSSTHPWWFYTAAGRHQAVADWYSLPQVSLREAFWDPLMIETMLGRDVGWNYWEIGQQHPPGPSESNISVELKLLWAKAEAQLFVDPAHYSDRGHEFISHLLILKFKLFYTASYNAGPTGGMDAFPTFALLPSLSQQEAEQCFRQAHKLNELLPLPPIIFEANRQILALPAAICRRRYAPYDPYPGHAQVLELDIVSMVGWSTVDTEGKLGYLSDKRTPSGAELLIRLDQPLQHDLSLLIQVSGKLLQGSVEVTLSCLTLDNVSARETLYISRPQLVEAVTNGPITISSMIPIQTELNASISTTEPASPPCQYTHLSLRTIRNEPFILFGYLQI